MTIQHQCPQWKPIILCFGSLCCFLLLVRTTPWPRLPLSTLVRHLNEKSNTPKEKNGTSLLGNAKFSKEQCLTACKEFIQKNWNVSSSVQKDGHKLPQTPKQLEKKKWLSACQKFLPKAIDTTWGSHVVVLLAALFVTNGPIVEFGCGYHSTPLIHNFTLGTQRQILSADTVVEWLNKFHQYKSRTHKFKHVDISKGWQEWEKIGEKCKNFEYDLILVDHHPDHRRTADAVRVANCGKLVVLHDTESKKYYKFGPIFENYRFSYETQRFGTGVMAMSNFKRELVNGVEKLVNMYLDSVHCSALDCN